VSAGEPVAGSTSPEHRAEVGGVARAAGIVASGNVASRILGLFRVTLIAGLFGATGLVSAYQIAVTVPTMVYDLLVGGLLSSALVPVFSEYAAAKNREELSRLVSTVLGVAAAMLVIVIVAIEVFAPQIAWLLGGGLPPELRAVATRSIRIVAVALFFLGLSGIVTAVLYTMKRFTYPAFAAAAFNVGIILAALLLSGSLGIYSLAVGVVLGSAMQLAIQLPNMRDIGVHLRIDLSHPALRRIIYLYLPVLAGLLVSQTQVAIDRNLASHTGEQSIAWMQNATTLIQFPHGLIAVAISLAVLPSLARFSALKDWDAYRGTLSVGLRLVIVLIVPATVGMFILAYPIVTLIFEHGRFTPSDTYWTAVALRFYLFGLVFASIDWPLNYAFYARQDTVTPALVGVFSVAVYLTVALTLLPAYGMIGLVFADSCKHFSHAITMLILTHRRVGGLDGRRMTRTVLKTIAMSAAMAIVMLFIMQFLPGWSANGKFLKELVTVGIVGGAGLVVYVACGALLKQEEMAMLWSTVRSRLPIRS
jgi:putative peptidoglycan lipid II flippase